MALTHQTKIEPPTEKDRELAKATFAWMESLVGSEKAEKSDYIHNMSIYGKTGTVNARGIGIVASAIVAYQRELNDRSEQASNAGSKHVGKVGERVTLFVTLISVSSTQYGWCSKFKSADGDIITALGSRLEHADGEKKGTTLARGESTWMKGTVKRHSEWKLVKETILGRAVSTLDPEAAKAAKKSAAKAAKRTETLAGEVEVLDQATGQVRKFPVYDIEKADGTVVGWCVREAGKKGKQLAKEEYGQRFSDSDKDSYGYRRVLVQVNASLSTSGR